MKGIKCALNAAIDHYIVVCLFLALSALSLLGVGNVLIVEILGVILCVAGLAQGAVRADLWILAPFIFYNLFCMVSCYATYKNITLGFASVQLIYPVFYLLMAYLDDLERFWLRLLCVAWAEAIAAAGLGVYVCRAVTGSGGRLGGVFGNPNAFGIFLLLSWFILLDCGREKKENHILPQRFLWKMEPILLIALALTLSMGSFLAMAAGMLVLITGWKRDRSWKEALRYGSILVARVSLGMGTGVLMYLGADRTKAPWICPLLLVYAVALVCCWEKFWRFLEENIRIAVWISGVGVFVAAAVVAVRPNAAATFAERLEMMKNGLGYMFVNPLLGVGPYQWRALNLQDTDKFFNTYYIHNVFIHVGVEVGLIALAMLLIITIRCFLKKRSFFQLAGCMAFLCHNLMDAGFFYLGIVVIALIMAGEPNQKGKALGIAAVKCLFGVFAVLFGWNLYWYMRMARGW